MHARGHLVEVEWRAGNWDAAAAHAAAVARWSRESGHGQEGAARLLVALMEAGRGDIGHARALAATGAELAEAQGDSFVRGRSAGGSSARSSCRSMIRRRRCAGSTRSPTCCRTPVSGIPAPIPFTPDLIEAWAATGHLDRAASRLAWLQDAARAWTTPGRGSPAAAPKPPCGSRNATPPRPSRGRGGHPRGTRAGAAVRARPLPAGAGHRAAQGPPAPRRRRHPRRSRRHLRPPRRPALAGAGRGAAGPPRARTATTPSRPPSGASPTSSPPGTATPRSPPPCTSASRPSKPTSPASTANSASAAGSTWHGTTSAKAAQNHAERNHGDPWRRLWRGGTAVVRLNSGIGERRPLSTFGVGFRHLGEPDQWFMMSLGRVRQK